MDLETLKQWWEFAVPIAPYLGVIVLVYGTMRNGIRPMIKSKRGSNGKYKSKTWYYIRRARFAFPALLGLAFGEISNIGGPEVDLFWCMVCGASSQWLVDAARDFAKTKGYNLPSPSDSVAPAAK